MGTLDKLMEKYGDDLDGLVEKFRSSGLGDKVESWIGTGQNEQISKDVSLLRQNNKLTPQLLAKYMRDPNPTYFLCALSQMAEIDFLTAKHLCEKKEIDALAIACKAAGLDKALFLTYAMIMLSDQQNAMGKASEYGQLYNDLPRDTALRTIRFWRMRRVGGHAA